MSLAVLLFAGLVINAGWATPLKKPGELKTLLFERFDLAPEYDKPVVKVIRTAADYEKLRKTHDKLPAVETVDLDKNAVVAVYMTLPDPCHFLAFEQSGGKLRVTAKADPDTMCIQVLSESGRDRTGPGKTARRDQDRVRKVKRTKGKSKKRDKG